MATEEKLAAAEARALKSEYCLLKLRQYLDDHADVDERPDTNEARPNDYMRVLVAMDTMLIDLTAARELMAKAAERDALREELTNVRPYADCYKEACRALGISNNIIGHVRDLRAERDALAAHCKRLKKSLAKALAVPENLSQWQETKAECQAILNATPAASLAAYRDGVLEEVAVKAESKASEYTREAARQHDGNCPIMGRRFEMMATSSAQFAAEIRAMKEAK